MNLAVNARDAMPGGGTLGHRDRPTCELEAVRARPAGRARRPVRTRCSRVSDTGMRHGRGDARPASSSRSSPPRSPARAPASGSRRCTASCASSGGRDPGAQRGGPRHHVQDLPAPGRDRGRAPAAPTRPGRRGRPPGSETILLVEDEADVRALAREVLERQGYTRAGGERRRRGLSGATSTQASRIDLLLTDVVMPRMSGRELAERVRGRPGPTCACCTCRATPTTPSSATACSTRACSCSASRSRPSP